MRHLHSTALAALIAAATLAGQALAGPFDPVSLVGTIAIPSAGPGINPNPGGAFTGFDISFFDATTGRDYVADRSNAAVDVFSGLSFLGRTDSVFAGQKPSNAISGPDGVVTVNNGSQHTLFAGDGDSTLKSFDISSPGLPPPTQFAPISTGGLFRADEMAYSPSANLVLVANNADAPAFGTLVNASTGAVVAAHITLPGAAPTDGLEQPVWNPATNSFFISVPQIGGTGAGGVAEIHTDGTVGRIYDFTSFGIASCSPTGLALGASGHLVVGCGNAGTQTVVLDPTGTGSIVKTFTQISGTDEVWYDPANADFYVTGSSGGGRVFDIINDPSLSILQSVPLPNVAAHSIAVDPSNGFVYVPLEGTTRTATDALCPDGCIAVFGAIPEPASLPLIIIGLAGLFGLAARRRVHSV